MALYIPHNIFHLARLLYVRPETFGPYYVDKAPIRRLRGRASASVLLIEGVALNSTEKVL